MTRNRTSRVTMDELSPKSVALLKNALRLAVIGTPTLVPLRDMMLKLLDTGFADFRAARDWGTPVLTQAARTATTAAAGFLRDGMHAEAAVFMGFAETAVIEIGHRLMCAEQVLEEMGKQK